MSKEKKTIKKPADAALSKYLKQKLLEDKEFAHHMKIVEEIMHKNRDVLKKLAE
jgi:hypothetical protein